MSKIFAPWAHRLIAVVFSCLLAHPVFAQSSSDALVWTNATPNSLDFTPTLYVVGDPKMPAAALRGLSRIIHPQGAASGSDSLLIPAVKAGVLISLFFACVAWFTKGRLGLIGWCGIVFVAWLMFIQTATVRVQTYFSYSGSVLSTGQLDSSGLVANGNASTSNGLFAVGGAGRFELVDGVPLGFALPVAISGAISTSLADLFMTSYSTTNPSDTGKLQFADPLKVLLELRGANPCVSAQLCKSIFEYTRYCLVGTVTDNTGAVVPAGIDLQAIARSPTALDDLFAPSGFTAAGWTAGTTRYYPPPASATGGATLTDGIPMACTDAGPRIRDDIRNFSNGSTMRTQMGAATATPGTSESAVAATPTSATVNPAVGALDNLQQLVGLSTLDANATIQNLVAWKAIAAGINTVSTPMDSAAFTAMTMVTEATEKWRVDGAAEGSVFLRGLFSVFNVILFVLICFTPIVIILAVTMFGETFKILKEYVIAIVWTQSWFPAAVIINFYITETLATKLFSYNNANPAAIFAPINHVAFYEELASSLSSAGWMIGAIPVLTYALLRGSVQGIVALASKAGGGGGASYADESSAAPALATATNAKAMQTVAVSSGLNPSFAAGMNASGSSWSPDGSGASVGVGSATTATSANARSMQERAAQSASAAQQSTTELSAAMAKQFQQGNGVTLTFGSGKGLTFSSDNAYSDKHGVSKDLSSQVQSTYATLASLGASVADIAGALTGAAAAYKGAQTAGKSPAQAAAAAGAAGQGLLNKSPNAKGGKLGGAGAAITAFFTSNAIDGLSKGINGKMQWTANSEDSLSNAIKDSAEWARKSGVSESIGFRDDVTGMQGATATDTESLQNAWKQTTSATQTAQRDATNAETATSTAAKASSTASNVALSQGTVENSSRLAGLTKSDADNSVGNMVARLGSSGAITEAQGGAAVAEYDQRYQNALARLPATQQGTAAGQVTAAISAMAGMAVSGSTVASQIVGGSAFGDIASKAGTRTGKSAVTESGAAISAAYLGSTDAAQLASASGSNAFVANSGSSPAMPAPQSIPISGTNTQSAVAAQIASTGTDIAAGQKSVNASHRALESSAAAGAAAAERQRDENRDANKGAVAALSPGMNLPNGPIGSSKSLVVPDNSSPPSPRTSGKFGGTGALDQTPSRPPASENLSLPRSEPSEREKQKQALQGLTPAAHGLVASLVNKHRDVSLPVASAIARSRGTADWSTLGERIIRAPSNLNALSQANVRGIGNASALPDKTQGELAVFMDQLGRDNAIALLQGKLDPNLARTELAKLVSPNRNSDGAAADGAEISGKLIGRYDGNPQQALLAYASAMAVARAAGASPPSIEGRTPSALELEIFKFMDRAIDPMNLVGGFAGNVLLNEAVHLGGRSLGLAESSTPPQEPPPKPVSASWAPTEKLPNRESTKHLTQKRSSTQKLPPEAERAIESLRSSSSSSGREISEGGLRRLIGVESGGSALAKNALGSSATGLGQFVESTWIDQALRGNTSVNRAAVDRGMVEQTPNGGHRVVEGKYRELLDLRNDAAVMVRATADYARQNLSTLSKANLDGIGDVSKLTPQQRDAYAYVLHLLGPGNGIKFLRGGDSGLSENESRSLLVQQVGVNRATSAISTAGSAREALQQFTEQIARRVADLPLPA